MKTLFIFFAVLFSSIPVTNAQTAQQARGLRVEIMIFSGRPNPVFEITDPRKIQEVRSLVAALPKKSAAKSSPEHPKLGYQGIEVKAATIADSEFHSFRVKGASVQVRSGAGEVRKGSEGTDTLASDASGVLESRLLTLAREQGVIDDRTLDFIKKSK